ncbi:hypothetical protein EC973_000621 [Apophysomyces ossiformis]|uniref:YncI copper-binding domain-containing protein n=1 Tax=Apophysomyces ossiformis TaxID=679940 RepID=A0A8H7BYR3_9FUNG|nr:hypothetical protein EC973_000621 [Apophysomyces ossiformis]
MARSAILACAIALLAATTQAHVGIVPASGKPGQSLNASFHVPHGCSGSPTISVSVSVPDTVLSITPAQLQNWTLAVGYRSLDKPIQVDGKSINQTVSNFTWSGGILPSDQYQDFPVQITLPQVDLTNQPNVTLYFPTVQTCANGTAAWTGIPNTPGYNATASKPSPQIIVTNAEPSTTGDGHGHDHGNQGNNPTNGAINMSLDKFPMITTIAVSAIGVLSML